MPLKTWLSKDKNNEDFPNVWPGACRSGISERM